MVCGVDWGYGEAGGWLFGGGEERGSGGVSRAAVAKVLVAGFAVRGGTVSGTDTFPTTRTQSGGR